MTPDRLLLSTDNLKIHYLATRDSYKIEAKINDTWQTLELTWAQLLTITRALMV